MRHPYRKFIQIELISLFLALLFGLAALVLGYFIILFLAFYFIVLSILCDAMILLQTRHSVEAGKQVMRGIILFLFTTYLLFQL
ncbi:hypothetical protein [Oceanobacillus polygoni]|uniref:Uncharacterized protein n=1 Tax=Oceanobacillus polygoni TaxID=1235259 RepID=A0A9X0YNK1_9BACI|nr:hypothetical protein [Oceanobacillus polygoni]MBP2076268.1 hypothetical protein [Oceanobacillus polygoni]